MNQQLLPKLLSFSPGGYILSVCLLLALVLLSSPGGAATGGAGDTGLTQFSDPQRGAQAESHIVSPTDPRTIYVGSEIDGILKSTDGGTHWMAANRGLPVPFTRRTYPPRLAVRQEPMEAIYAVIGYPVHSGLIQNRLYRSLDGAAHWREVKRLPDNWMFDSLTDDPAAPNQLTLESDHGQLVVEDRLAAAEGPSLAELEVEPTELSWTTDAMTGLAQQPDSDEGNIAVLHDDGTFLQEFDLANRTLQFTPNGFGGYDVAAIGFAFESNLGNRQALGDDDFQQVNLPFFFPFFGVSRNVLFVNSNGNITFDSGDGDATPSIVEFVSGGPRIAPLWDDFNPAATTGSNGVFVRTLGSRVVITWNNVPEFNTTNSNTVQLVLFNDGRIRVSYRSVATKDGLVGISNGTDSSFFRVNFDQELPASFTSAAPILQFFNRGLDLRAVAQRFYQSHPDSFDFLIIFGSSTFPHSLAGPDALSATEIVKNDVSGIGLPNFDHTAAFGSAGRLQSVVVMNRLSEFPNDVNEQIGRSTFSTLDALGRAVGHRWAAYVRFNDGGVFSDELLGRCLANWSFFHDTDASLLEGNDWLDVGGNSFRSDDATNRFSPLDQYLMGLRSAGEVPNFSFISNPSNTGGRDRTSPPEIGVTVNGIRRTVSVNQIIQVEGPRVPTAGVAPDAFRQAFVLIVPQGEEASQADLAKLDTIRQAWETAFRAATDNRGSVQTELVAAGPDLVVQGLTVMPTTVNPGGTVSVSFSIVNQGTQNAGSTFHEIRLSNDNTIDAGDTLLATVVTPTLTPGQSIPFNNLVVTIPSGISTGTRFIGVIADSSSGVTESNEGNNTASTALNIGSTLADLVVTNLAVSPASVAPGATATVSFTILNQGSGSAVSATHEVRLSTDSAIDAGDTLLTTVGTASLPPGGSQVFNLPVTIPSGTPPGARFIGVRADAGGSVAESNEGNNTAAAAITITAPLPDLVVTSLTVNPTSTNAGGSVTVSFNIVNQGGTTAGSATHQIVLSPDSTITTSDTVLSTVGTPSLAPGNSIPFSVAVTIPASTSSGTMFIGVIADVTGQVSESNEGNNTASTPVTITGAQADLVVINLSVTPSTAAPGASVTVNFSILNQGSAAAASTTHNIHLSTDANISASDPLLVTVGSGALGPGSSQPFSQVVTIPGATPSGTRFIGVIADAVNGVAESNEGNNTASVPITITGAQPDLVVTGLTVTPPTVSAGGMVAVGFTIANQGSGTANAAAHEIRLSPDAFIDASDTFLNIANTTALGPGGSIPINVNVTIPPGTPPSTMFIGVIADAGNSVAESNEANNTTATPITITGAAQADLVVTNLTLAPTSADAGDTVTVNFTIHNQGSAAAGPASHEIRFSGDTTIDASDTLLTTTFTGSLAAGASMPFSESVTLPTSATQGTSFIGVIADAGNAVTESNESNNTASAAITITSFNEVEPNNNAITADTITPNVTVVGTIGAPGDVDFFRFSLAAFQTVIIDIDAQSLSPASPLDSVVTLFDTTGLLQLDENDDENAGTRDSRLMFTTIVPGEFVFRVKDFSGNGGPDFKYKAKVTIQ